MITTTWHKLADIEPDAQDKDKQIVVLYRDGEAVVTSWADECSEGTTDAILAWGYVPTCAELAQ